MGMSGRQGCGGRRAGWRALPPAVVAVVLASSMASVSGQGEPAARYRTAPDRPVATTAEGLRSQRQVFRGRLDSVQAEIGRLNRALDAKRSGLKSLDEQVIQAHLSMLAAEHLVYEAQRRGLPDLLERRMRAADRKREWADLEERYRTRVEGEGSGLLEQLTLSRALAADLVVDWNLANDRLRLLESPPTANR